MATIWHQAISWSNDDKSPGGWSQLDMFKLVKWIMLLLNEKQQVIKGTYGSYNGENFYFSGRVPIFEYVIDLGKGYNF